MNEEKIILTNNGLRKLTQKIGLLEMEVKEIQAEKAIAYTASGDGWHDNPGFNQLEQKEFEVINRLSELRRKVATCTVVEVKERNIENIQVGSIIRLERSISGKKSILIWEIVGHDESDLKNGHISYDTPVGTALLGKKVDDIVYVDLPIGTVFFKILALIPSWEDI